jgi:predicted nicotinamide N-methyase
VARLVAFPGAGRGGTVAVTSLRPRTILAPGGPLVLFETADADADLDEAITTSSPAPYGRVLWSSAPCVAQVVAGLQLHGARVLELGCGTGLVSLVAARLGATVLATDVDGGALLAVETAAAAARVTLSTAHFDILGDAPLPAADVVVAADLIYENALATALARRTLEGHDRGATIVIGDPGRVFRERFLALLGAHVHDATFTPIVAAGHAADVWVLPPCR